MAGIAGCLSALGYAAPSHGPVGLAERALEAARGEARIAPFLEVQAHNQSATVTAGAVLRAGRTWRARLFVSRFEPLAVDGEAFRLRASSTVGAQVTGRIARDTRLAFDVFNVFDQRTPGLDPFAWWRVAPRAGTLERYLFHPAEPRGFRITVSRTF